MPVISLIDLTHLNWSPTLALVNTQMYDTDAVAKPSLRVTKLDKGVLIVGHVWPHQNLFLQSQPHPFGITLGPNIAHQETMETR
jgi:hypothetical protein